MKPANPFGASVVAEVPRSVRSPRDRALLLGAACVALAVLAAVAGARWLSSREAGSAATASASPSPSGIAAKQVAAFTRQGVTFDQAERAVQVQGELNRADFLAKVEEGLGAAYGGVWFDPATAKLHVGVTSTASRREAQALAAQAGLAGRVVTAPVRSTWAELLAAQLRWDRRFSRLLGREQMVTATLPQRNALEVRLSSSLPGALRAALERDADRAGVRVTVKTLPPADLRLAPQARCVKFVSSKAYCDPTIVGGVSIEEVKGKERCTAGPSALRRSLALETTETFILTAGHCVKVGGVGETWKSWNKAGEPKEIGPVITWVYGKTDVGVIQVTTKGPWASGGNPPVVPTIAFWSALESEPFSVPGEVKSGVGLATCISGQTSGTHCGTVKAVNVTAGEREKLVEVEGTNTEGGDSGAPWWSGEEKSKHWVEGTHIGLLGTNPVFGPLWFSFEQLEAKIALELLTSSNEVRPNEPMK